jgi:hypothetical protein
MNSLSANSHQTSPPRKANRVSQLNEYYQNSSTTLASTPKTPVRNTLVIEPGPSPAATLAKCSTNPRETLRIHSSQINGNSTAVPSPLFSQRAHVASKKVQSTLSAPNLTITIPITVTLPVEVYYKDCQIEALGLTRVSFSPDEVPAADLNGPVARPYSAFCVGHTLEAPGLSTSPEPSGRAISGHDGHLISQMEFNLQPIQSASQEQSHHALHLEPDKSSSVGWWSARDHISETRAPRSINSAATNEPSGGPMTKEQISRPVQYIKVQKDLSCPTHTLTDDVIGPNRVLGEEVREAPKTLERAPQLPNSDARRNQNMPPEFGLKRRLYKVSRKLKPLRTRERSTAQQ